MEPANGFDVRCGDCGAHFNVDPSGDMQSAACEGCGGNRFFRDQPSPTQSDGTLRNMVDSDTQIDSGGNPLGEGTIMGSDGERPGWKRDNYMHGNVSSLEVDAGMWDSIKHIMTSPELAPDACPECQGMGITEGTMMPGACRSCQGTGKVHAVQAPMEQMSPYDPRMVMGSEKFASGAQARYVNQYVADGNSRVPRCPACGSGSSRVQMEGDPTNATNEDAIDSAECPACGNTWKIAHSATERVEAMRPSTLNTKPYTSLWDKESDFWNTVKDIAEPVGEAAGLAGLNLIPGVGEAADAAAIGDLAAGGAEAAGDAAGAAGEDAASGGIKGLVQNGLSKIPQPAGYGAIGTQTADKALPSLMKGALGQGGSGAAPPMGGGGPARPMGMMEFGSVGEIPSLLTAALETSDSVKSVDEQHDDPENQDQKEFNDGDHDPSNMKNPNLEDSGQNGEDNARSDSTTQGGFGDGSPGLERAMMIMPLLLHYFNSEESGQDDPIIRGLHEALENEMPGYMDHASPDSDNAVQQLIQHHKSPHSAGVNAHPPCHPPCPDCGSQLADGGHKYNEMVQQYVPTVYCPNCGLKGLPDGRGGLNNVRHSGVNAMPTGMPSVPSPGTDLPAQQIGDMTGGKCPMCGGTLAADGSCPQCFVAGTMIQTNQGLVAIEYIQPGDKVLTESGYNTVREVMSRHYEGDILEVSIGAQGQIIRVTPDHPFRILASDDCHMRDRCGPGNCGTQSQTFFESKHRFDWSHAGCLTTDSYIVSNVAAVIQDLDEIKVPRKFTRVRKKGQFRKGPNKFELTPDFLWAIGLYIAEGSHGKRDISYGLHSNETEYQDRLQKIFKAYGYTTRIDSRGENGVAVIVNSSTLAEWLPYWVGDLCDNKHIPEELMRLPDAKIKSVLQGINDGDGSQEYDQLRQTSSILATQIVELSIRLGNRRIASVQREYPKNKRPIYIVHRAMDTLNSGTTHTCNTWKLWDKQLYRVQSITRTTYAGEVYNLGVEEDPTYTVGNTLVHNCGFKAHPQGGASQLAGGGNPSIPGQPQPFVGKVANGVGPQTPEQKAAVEQLLINKGRAAEIPLIESEPQRFWKELAEIQQTSNTAPLVDPSQMQQTPPGPPGGMQGAPGAMPVMDPSQPGGGGGQPMQPMSHVLADANSRMPRCPECGSGSSRVQVDGGDPANASAIDSAECPSCGHTWKIAKSNSLILTALINPSIEDAASQMDIHPEQGHDPSQTWVDASGNPLQIGQTYELTNPQYPVPDEVKIVTKKPDELGVKLVGEVSNFDANQNSSQPDFKISPQQVSDGQFTFNPSDQQGSVDDPQPKGGMPGMEQIPQTPPTTDETSNTYQNGGATVSSILTSDEITNDLCSRCGSNDISHIASSASSEMHQCYRCENSWESHYNDDGIEDGSRTAAWIMEDDAEPDDFFDQMDNARKQYGGMSRNIASVASSDERYQEIKNRLNANKMSREAGRHFSPVEQRGLINESGTARNADMLDLTGTHYESNFMGYDPRDPLGRANADNAPDSHVFMGL
jgi:DNA-directed RNA polymerase subunit M/transcription elongation factor TFIIS